MKHSMKLPAGHYQVVAEFARCQPVPVVIRTGGMPSPSAEAKSGVPGSGNPSRNQMIGQPGGKPAARSGASAEAGE